MDIIIHKVVRLFIFVEVDYYTVSVSGGTSSVAQPQREARWSRIRVNCAELF